MREVFNQLPVSLPIPNIRRTPSQALSSVTSKNGLGVYASADRLFKGAVFGRDSLEVADDLMYINPRLVRRILLTQASLIGEENNIINEEEPGKIVHEYRMSTVDGKLLDKTSREIFETLGAKWGGNEQSLAYYGSIDSTPLFIKELSAYCQAYGMEILTEQVRLRSDKTESLIVILESAIDWLVRHLNESRTGFVEFKRINPQGIKNQAWKDSAEFYVHPDGEMANHDQPISSIEVQAAAYDALRLASEILPSHRDRLMKLAEQLGKKVFELLWMPDRDYFALGTDFSPQGELRVIKTMTANPTALLDSMIFDDLPAADKQKYISGIAREAMGTAFLTDAGIRSRSLEEAELIKFWDYHGSYVTWPKETYDFAKGLYRQGLPAISAEQENRLVDVTRAARSNPEFFFVDARGRVLGMPYRRRKQARAEIVSLNSPNRPESIQAWTVSAIIAILDRRARSGQVLPTEPWRGELQTEILHHIPHVPRLKSAKELAARYPAYPYEISEERP